MPPARPVPPDKEDDLLRRCQQGDATALEALVQLYRERVFRLAYRVLGDAARAEEAAADALAKVWAKCGQWRGESSAATWIYRVALRTALDHQRARRRWWRLGGSQGAADVPDTAPDPPTELSEQECRERTGHRLEEALGRLSADDRALVHLYYYEGQNLAAIGAILGITRDAAKMRLARARGRLREFLKGADDLL